MIIRINVAPEQKVETNIREIFPALAIAGIVAAAFYYAPIMYAGSIESEAQEIAAKTQTKKDQLAALELDLNKIKAVQAVIADLESRKRVIQSLADGRKQAVLVLETLQDIQLDRMWLDLLEYKSNLMQIKGWASDYGVISEYVRRIKTTTGLGDEGSIDTQAFRPTFDATPAPTAPLSQEHKGDVMTVRFSDIMLKESSMRENSESPTNLPIQIFELEFNPNIEQGAR